MTSFTFVATCVVTLVWNVWHHLEGFFVLFPIMCGIGIRDGMGRFPGHFQKKSRVANFCHFGSTMASLSAAPGPKRARARLVIDDEAHKEGIAWLKKERDRTLSRGELVDIVAVQLHERHQAHLDSLKSGRPPKVEFADRTAAILNRSKEKCQKVWKQYVEERVVSEAPAEGPRGAKNPLIPRTLALGADVREWLHEREISRERTVARDLLAFLISTHVLPQSVMKGKRSIESALRTVQRYVKAIGLRRGKRKGQTTYLEQQHIIVMRDTYATHATELQKTRRFVYTDESFIHQHYKAHDDTLHDPSDKRPVPKEMMKGRRFCFIAAIVSAEPPKSKAPQPPLRAQEDHPPAPSGAADGAPPPAAAASSGSLSSAAAAQLAQLVIDEPRAHLMPETVDIFRGGKQKKDYHAMFNGAYYVEWMKKLLAALKARNITNAVIVMDNAKYHKTLPPGMPKKSWKKQPLIDACTSRGIEVLPKDTRAILWDKLQKLLGDIKPEIVAMAESQGHTVLFTPPRYSELQPIETVWAIVKGRVGRQYTTATTLADVEARLKAEFAVLVPKTVEACIQRANKNLAKLLDLITRSEKAHEDDSSSEREEDEEDEENEEGEEEDEVGEEDGVEDEEDEGEEDEGGEVEEQEESEEDEEEGQEEED